MRIINGLIATDGGEVGVSGEAITPDTCEAAPPYGMHYLGRWPVPAYDGVAQPDADGPPAVVALFLRSLLPIVWNTQAGLLGIDPTIIVSARDLVPPRA